MAQVNTNISALPYGAVTIHRAVSAAEALIEAVAAWNARRRTARELSRLSRRQLSDIGLEGVDLEAFAARLRR